MPDIKHNGISTLALLRLFAFVLLSLGTIVAETAFAQQEYLLVPGDILKISVFKNPDLSLDVRVSDVGSISYPLVGAVPVAGLTLPAAERKIGQMLKDGGFVINPQVNILLTQGFGNLVSVLGEVRNSGRYSLDAAGGHFSGMLAAAGGVDVGGGDSVIVTGIRGGKPFRHEVDIVKMAISGTPADDIELAGGDTIYVARAPLFYIYGPSTEAGTIPLRARHDGNAGLGIWRRRNRKGHAARNRAASTGRKRKDQRGKCFHG